MEHHPVNFEHIAATLRKIDLYAQSLRTMLQNAIDQGVVAAGAVDVSGMTTGEVLSLAQYMLISNGKDYQAGDMQSQQMSFTVTEGKGPTYD